MKKIVIIAVVAAMASLSQASELWWTVGDGDGANVDLGAWDTAKLYASSTGYNYGGTLIESVSNSDLAEFGYWTSTIDSSTSAFYIELSNSGTFLGRSYVSTGTPPQGATPYATLADANAINTGNLMNPTATAYSFSQFTTSEVIPEPTSGLLMLLGMMALGLKRKKV